MEELLTPTDKARKVHFFRKNENDISIGTNNESSIKNINMPTSSTNEVSSSKIISLPAPLATNHINKLALNSRQKNALLRQKLINELNNFNRCKLRKIKPLVNTRYEQSKAKFSLLEKFDIPAKTIEKYNQFIRPMDDEMMKKLMRPKIYYYLEVKNIRPLGRIVIQLFTEACPEVVLEFVRMCMENNLSLLQFKRLFPMLWMEGELMFDQETLAEPNFEYDTQVLDHGYGPGILSFAKHYCNTGFIGGVIHFSLSFKPLVVANEDRVVFGVVTRGLRILDVLQDFGTKNGKTKKDIIVIKCGMIH